MDSSREEVLHHIKRIESGARTILVAIDGHGGAGKSSLAAWLGSQVDATIIHIDDFGRPGRPYEAWDWDRFREQILEPLMENRTARYQRYDWDSESLAEWIDVEAGGVVIAEGVSITRTELDDPWDLTVWVECPYELRLARGLQRDGEGMRDTWVNVWMPEEDRYVAEQQPHERADYVVLGYDSDLP